MADTKITIDLDVTGAKEGAEDFEELKVKQLEAAAAAASLTSEINKLSKAEGDNSKKLAELRRQLVQTTQSQKELGQKAAEAQTRMGDAAARTAGRMGQMASAVGNVGSVIGQVNPSMQRASSVIGMMGGAASAAAGAMGPLGIAMAAITVAAGVYAIAMQRVREEQARVAAGARALRFTLDEVSSAMRRVGAQRAASAALQGGTDINAAVENLAVAQGRARMSEAAIAQLVSGTEGPELRRFREEGLTGVSAGTAIGSDVGGEIRLLLENAQRGTSEAQRIFLETSQRAGVAAERSQLEGQASMAEAASAKGRRPARGGGRSQRRDLSADILQKETQQLEEIRRLEQERLAFEDVLEESRITKHDAELARIQERTEAEKTSLAALLDERNRAEDEAVQRAFATKQKEEAIAQASMDRVQEQADEFQEYITPIVSGLVEAFKNIAAGTETAEEAFKNLLASYLEFISQKAAIAAAEQYAEAIANFASQNYEAGALNLAAGVAYTAVAVAAGAASGALAGASGAAPASPGGDTRERGGGDQTIVVNLTGSVVTAATRAELGRELTGLVEEGTRRYEGRI